MDNTKSFFIGLMAVVAMVLGGVAYFKPSVVQLPPYGSASSPSVVGGCMEVNGIKSCYERVGMRAATTTICALRSPTATSTLRSSFVGSGATGVTFSVSSTTASLITFAKATTVYATTTILGTQASIAANAKATVFASTTAAQQTAGDNTFAPNEYLVIGMQGGTGTFSPTGFCQAVWDVI